MALKSRTRGWLDAASTAALEELRADIQRLAGEVGTLRLRGEEQEARRQHEAEMLRDDLAALADRFEAHMGRTYVSADDLADLQNRVDGKDAKLEDLRIALAGLSEQVRWESDDLRKALSAIIERVDGRRKQV